jgi:hypothetical protein
VFRFRTSPSQEELSRLCSPPPAACLHPDLFAGHAPCHLAGLHAVNTFFIRVAFDLFRSQRFHESVRKRLMLRLANINVPHYITPLRLQSMDLGTVPPMIKSAHSLPSPKPSLIPRLVMHVVYSGQCNIVIQTNVDLKDSPGYINFDKALEVFGTDATLQSDADMDAAAMAVPAGGPVSASASAAKHVEERAVSGGRPDGIVVQESGESRTSPVSSNASAALVVTTSASQVNRRAGGVAARGYQSIKNMMYGGPSP